MEVYTEDLSKQARESNPPEIPLRSEHRRLLLGASLRLLVRRFSHGRPIFRADVAHVIKLTDDAERAA